MLRCKRFPNGVCPKIDRVLIFLRSFSTRRRRTTQRRSRGCYGTPLATVSCRRHRVTVTCTRNVFWRRFSTVNIPHAAHVRGHVSRTEDDTVKYRFAGAGALRDGPPNPYAMFSHRRRDFCGLEHHSSTFRNVFATDRGAYRTKTAVSRWKRSNNTRFYVRVRTHVHTPSCTAGESYGRPPRAMITTGR